MCVCVCEYANTKNQIFQRYIYLYMINMLTLKFVLFFFSFFFFQTIIRAMLLSDVVSSEKLFQMKNGNENVRKFFAFYYR